MKKLFLSAIIIIICGNLFSQKVNQEPSVDDISSQVEKFNQVLNVLNKNYVDTVNIPILTEEAIKGMLSALDPHSVYISAKDVKAVEEPLLGSFEGLELHFKLLEILLTSSK